MEDTDREQEYITACLASGLFPGQVFPHPEPDVDWEKLFILIRRQRLSGHMFMLAQNIVTGWPANFEHHLRLDYYQYLLYGEYCSSHVKNILEAITRLGVRVIVLKGWAHIQTIYARDHGQRLCEDIDILIHPNDVDLVEDIFRRQNYIIEEQSWPGYNRRYHNGTRYFVSEAGTEFGSAFSIGLHWGLIHTPSYNPGRINVDALFTAALPLSVLGITVLQLAPEDEIIYLCGHTGLHHYDDDAIYRYYELAALMVMAGVELDWSKVLEGAMRWHLVLPVMKTLHKIDRLWEGIVSAEILTRLDGIQPGLDEKLVDLWMERTRGLPAFDHVLKWITFPQFWKRPLIMLQDIFPGPEYMISRYGDAPLKVWPLLYLRRFFRAFRLVDM